MKLIPEPDWFKSCDNCRHQEGRHYCLFHGESVKNMDIFRCGNWRKADPLSAFEEALLDDQLI